MAERPTETTDEASQSGNVRWSIGFWSGLAMVLALAVIGQRAVWKEAAATPEADWWSGRSPDWLPVLPLLLLSAPLWLIRRSIMSRAPRWWARLSGWGGESCPTSRRSVTRREEVRAVALSLLVAAAGFLMSRYVSGQFGDLPPAYHDEFSYLLQAETFAQGQTSYPSHAQMPELFDQVHVLNEGRFASRYFPGVGLWMAPFLAAGNPWWGHQIAHAFASFLLFWIGRHLKNNAVGLLAGLLLAVSPGIALFSNLLLSHHPTLIGLLVFVITFLKLTRAIDEGTTRWGWAILSGCGLAYAMICRPMTAAGIGLPFGIWFAWWVWTGRGAAGAPQPPGSQEFRHRLRTAMAMGLPLVVGAAGLLAYNHAITGNVLLTPYQQYTEIYTPRHVYGFNNVIRGEQRLGPKVLENYDRWAENLTPSLAARNVGRRITSSLQWTLGIVPLVLVAVTFLVTVDLWNRDWQLMAAAIVGLHLVHIPYWFEGIMGWHYVLESAPFWLLLFAGVSERLWRHWEAMQRPGMPIWWTALVVVCIAANLWTVQPLWPARLDVGVVEVSFSRQRYGDFAIEIERITADRRALILVDSDPAERHIDFVTNSPQLDARVLFGRYRPDQTDVNQVVNAFPDRDVFLVHPANRQVEQLSRGSSPVE